ncbi:MAG: small ribosomal subunit Rsm22 family protein [Alphaproteobacteria bacterium]
MNAINLFFQKLKAIYPTVKFSELIQTYETLSERYRFDTANTALKNEKEVLVYCFGRLPATLGVLEKVLTEYKTLTQRSVESVTDLGCGPGASAFILHDIFPDLKSILCVENNPHMFQMAQKLTQDMTDVVLTHEDIKTCRVAPTDVCLFSYSLGELTPIEQKLALEKAWIQSTQALIVIEPGTPQGFKTQAYLRQLLIEKGAHILAPCGHNAPCPLLKDPTDWCHFPQKIMRNQEHQILKKGSLPYELEKYTYLIAIKTPVILDKKRLIRSPLKNHGHITLDLCTESDLLRQTLTKSKNKQDYKRARHLNWGDLF